MRTPTAMTAAAVLTALVLSGCSGGSGSGSSKLNPFNWFGRSKQEKTLTPVEIAATTDPRTLVDQVARMSVDRTPGGAIIRATGLPPTQGYWSGELVPENSEQPVKGVLTYRFVVAPPTGFEPTSTPQSRELVVARFVSAQKLEGVRQIRVLGARNARSSRR